MLDNFKRIYDEELDHYNALEFDVLNSRQVRMFVYEVCKNCLHDEEERGSNQIGRKIDVNSEVEARWIGGNW